MKKVVLSIFLVCCMMLSVVGCGQKNEESSQQGSVTSEEKQDTASSAQQSSEEESAYPDYLNLDTYYPLVKEGEDVTLKILLVEWDVAGYAEDRFFWKLVEEKMNIDVEIETIVSGTENDYFNMMFASDSMPDIVFNAKALTTDQLVTYGAVEGQLLDFAPFMEDATLMPNINALFEEFPTLKANMKAINGGIYSQTMVSDPEGVGIYEKRFINNGLIEEMGEKSPATLDEFVELLYKVKEKYPEITPLAGNYKDYNPSGILMNALGINAGKSSKIYDVGLKNGEPVMLAGDKECFEEYLSIMNRFFKDGIIHRDFFTMDMALVDNDIVEGKVFSYALSPKNPAGFESGKWSNIPVLTSDYSSEPIIGRDNLFSVGKVLVSSKTEYPELIARFLDYLYSDEGNYLYQVGPCVTQTEFAEVRPDAVWELSDKNSFVYPAEAESEFGANFKWNAVVGGINNMGSLGGLVEYRQEIYGRETIKSDYQNWLEEGYSANAWWRVPLYENYKPVATDGLPILYFEPDVSLRINELISVIKAYIEEETVKFITGDRVISETELDDYFKTLDELGFQEYMDYYKDAYTAYQANLQ